MGNSQSSEEAEGEADSRRPKKFWNNDLLRLYEQLPYPITPPEGWAKYKSKENGRPFGNSDPSRDLWGGDEKKDQIRRITRGEAAPIETAALPSIRPFLNFPEENRFSKKTLKLKNNLYLFSQTCGIRVTKEQRKTLNIWIEGARVIYNAALDSVKKKEMPLDLSKLEAAFSTATARTTEKRKPPPDAAAASSTRNLRPKRQQEVSSFASDFICGATYDEALKDAAGSEDSDQKNQKAGPKTDVPPVQAKYPTGYFLEKKKWLREIPSTVRVNAVRDVVKAYDSMNARVRKGLPGGEIKPRTSAKGNFAVVSPGKWGKGKSSFKMTKVPPPEDADNKHGRKRDHLDLDLGHNLGSVRVRQELPKSILQHDILIRRSRRGRFFITYVMEKRTSGFGALPALPAEQHRRIKALDPGVRAMVTCYEPDTGAHRQYGGGAHGRDKFKKLVEKAKTLVSEVAEEKKRAKEEENSAKEEENSAKVEATGEENSAKEEAMGEKNSAKKLKLKKKHKLKKLIDAKWKALDKVRNVRDNMRKQIAADLFDEAGITLLLPALPVHDLAQKRNPKTGMPRKLRKGTAEEMINLGHYKFRQFLKHKAVMKGCELVIVYEDYTTKTCGKCGHLNQNVGGNDVFTCNANKCRYEGNDQEMLDKCGVSLVQHNRDCIYVSGRDEFAARNIRLLQLSYFLSEENRELLLQRQASNPELDPDP